MLLAFSLILAAVIIPTLVWTLLFAWADRYEREPTWLIAVAFLWGALPAIVLSLIVEVLVGAPFVAAPDSLAAELVSSAAVAPIVEEIAKALVLLYIYRRRRQEFDGVLDGIVYGALVGFGFAMIENLFYFIGAFDEGGLGNLSFIIYLRAVVFSLNHAFYTALTGIGFGLARNSRSRAGRLFWPLAGLSAAILVHGLHNFGVSIASVNALGVLLSLAIAAASVGLLLITVLLAWRSERECVQAGLVDEVGVLLSQSEFAYLTGRWHRPLRPWGRSARNQADRLQLCVELAFRKQRLQLLGAANEPELAGEIEDLRGKLAAGAQPSG